MLRAALPALGAGIYLNTGHERSDAGRDGRGHAEQSDYELTVGPRPRRRLRRVRAAPRRGTRRVAAVLTADVDDIALTHATTDGMNLAVHGIDWAPGDRA